MFSSYRRCGVLTMSVTMFFFGFSLFFSHIFIDQIRKKAIDKLSAGFGSDPIEKILLAKKYGVSSWLLEGYAQLVGQQAPLQTETLDSLDSKTKVSLLSIRDRYPPAVYGDTQLTDHEGSPPSMVIDKLKVLKETFADELADMS